MPLVLEPDTVTESPKSEVCKTLSCSELEPQMATVIALQSNLSPCTDSAVPLGDMKASVSQGPKKMPVLYPEQVSPYQDDIYKSRTFVPTVPVLQYWKASRMRDKYTLS